MGDYGDIRGTNSMNEKTRQKSNFFEVAGATKLKSRTSERQIYQHTKFQFPAQFEEMGKDQPFFKVK